MPMLDLDISRLTPDLRAQILPLVALVKQGVVPEDALQQFLTAISDQPTTAASPGGIDWPGGLHPSSLPSFLAHPWIALCTEAHPRVQLYWLVDTAELLVRWTAAIALAEIRYASGGELPVHIAQAVAPLIERPTLGKWIAILRSFASSMPLEPMVTDGLARYVEDVVIPTFPSEGHGGHVENSLLVLRNQIAHSGALSTDRASALLSEHLPTLIRLLTGARDCLGPTLVASGDRRLHGVEGADMETAEPLSANGTVLVRGAHSPSLEPLAYHGMIHQFGIDGKYILRQTRPAAQLYARSSHDRLSYTPVGVNESHSERPNTKEFRELFQVDRAQPAGPAPSDIGFTWDSALLESRILSDDFIGRADELATVKAWVKSPQQHGLPRTPRLAWISGGPGTGKSALMAKLAVDYHQPRHRGLFFHRFRSEDPRNSRRAFLHLLRAALIAWKPLSVAASSVAANRSSASALEGQALEDDVKERLRAVASLTSPAPGATPPEFWLLIDGLDEGTSGDPGLPSLLLSLAVPGTLWIVASRPDRGLGAIFTGPNCVHLFEGGLPPMNAGDVRAMLVDGLGALRYSLFKRDNDTPVGVQNAFVEAVVLRAQGLPVYVQLLLEDLKTGRFSTESEDRLPESLSKYFDRLVERLGVSDAQRDLTAVVALLSQVDEPVDDAGLAYLLSRGSKDWESWLPRVAVALRVGASLVLRAAGPDALAGWILYNETFRDYVNSTPGLSGSVAEYRCALIEAADQWHSQLAPQLRSVRAHLFRRGTAYALRWPQAGGVPASRARLLNFAYLQARTTALRATDCADLALEYSAVLKGYRAVEIDRELESWEVFFRERVHLLLRGDASWGANKILLQLAVEHADDSPVTSAAEAWLATGACDWLWLRRAQRSPRMRPSRCLRVFEGTGGAVLGAMLLAGGRVLSWTATGLVQLWDLATWLPLATLDGHSGRVLGAAVLSDGRLCTWCQAGTVCFWDQATGRALGCLSSGHPTRLSGALLLADGRLLSWSDDAHDFGLRIRDLSTGAVRVLEGHQGGVMGATVLPDGRLLSWSRDSCLIVWDIDGVTVPMVLRGHCEPVNGATALPNGNLLSWAWDRSICLWDASSGRLLNQFFGHDYFHGATRFDDGSVMGWSWFYAMRWREDGSLLWERPLGEGQGCTLLHGEAFLSWSSPMRLWNINGGVELRALEGCERSQAFVNGATQLPDGRILSWGRNGWLRLWDGNSGAALVSFAGHSDDVLGALTVSNGTILSWSRDGTLRLWALEGPGFDGAGAARIAPTNDAMVGATDAMVGATDATLGATDAMVLAEGRVLCWGTNEQLYLFKDETGDWLYLHGHEYKVEGATLLDDGRLLSWDSLNYRLWDAFSGAPLADIPRREERHHPEVFLQWYRAKANVEERRFANVHCVGWTTCSDYGDIEVKAEATPDHFARWLCDEPCSPLLLLPTGGTLVSGLHTDFLHLWRGETRVSLAEAIAPTAGDSEL